MIFLSAMEATHVFSTTVETPYIGVSFMLFNDLQRFLGEIKTDNLTVSNSEIITFDFTVSKNRIFEKNSFV